MIFGSVTVTRAERAQPRPGDELVDAKVVMDRGFTVPGAPERVWPWLAQLGKGRAGWYLPRSIERFIPPSHRAARAVEPRWQQLSVGDVVPDYGGAAATFEVAEIAPAHTLVYRSQRGRMHISWAITLQPIAGPAPRTRVLLRLRLAPVRRPWLARVGELIDVITIAGLAAGLHERLDEQAAQPGP